MLTGARGETLAAQHLETLGFRVVARNHRCPRGEVDLIVEKGQLLVFVEVRTRAPGRMGDPEDTVWSAKQQRVVRAARDYLAKHDVRDRELRFDVIGIVDGPGAARVTHLPNAFDAGDTFTL
ncbi:MAG: YraN family protein [Deltaproteobacteria bacterium]|nr:YraN family protein [Deltaproteobacteria bacterium]